MTVPGEFPVCTNGAPCSLRDPVRDVTNGFVNYEICPACGTEYILIDARDAGEFWTERLAYEQGFGFVKVEHSRKRN